MKQRTRDIALRLQEIAEAWRKTAPDTLLAGMSLQEFQTATLPTREIRTELRLARLEIKGKIAAREEIDLAGRELAAHVVASVIADRAHGPNSPLYRAMDYVTKDERRSGLVRKRLADAKPA